MSNSPRISVIVPSYNQGHFIAETVRSVLSQDYPDLEVIVMDGGSTDSTLEVLHTFDDPRLRWISERDNGQSHAINKGMRMATGDLLSFLNSDDLLMPHALEQIAAVFAAHPTVDFVFGDVQHIAADGALMLIGHGKPFTLQEALISAFPMTQQGAVWRREVFATLGGFDESFHYIMDYDFWIRAHLAGFSLHYAAGVRAKFRLHGESKSVSQQPRFLHDWSRMVEKLYAMPTFPAHLQAMRPQSDAFIAWGWAKTHWQARDFAQARPLLTQFMRKGKFSRRMLAFAMWTDSYLRTPFTRMIAWGMRTLTGREVLFSDRRAI
jgi:glycosyltransferase involved in cell wall biosynthesis